MTRPAAGPLTDSEQGWLRVRRYLRDRRYDLGVLAAADLYRQWTHVAGTPLLAAPGWLPAVPVPLVDLDLVRSTATGSGDRDGFDSSDGFDGISGGEEAAAGVLPLRPDGSRYRRYSEVVRALAPPRVFVDRPTYRLLDAHLRAAPRLEFGRGSYFDSIDVGDACGHEYAGTVLGEIDAARLRAAVGDPCDLARRRANMAISTLTLRPDPGAGTARFLMHRRDAAAVGHAGGLYQVLPVGVFQPAGDGECSERTDFSLWRCMIREYAEEVLGADEDHGTGPAGIDYDAWPFAARMTAALRAGDVRVYCLGLGVDPLTFATDLLTVAVFDADVHDELFGRIVRANAEGAVLAAVPFEAATIDHFTGRAPTQAAGAALLRLAWQHRATILGGRQR